MVTNNKEQEPKSKNITWKAVGVRANRVPETDPYYVEAAPDDDGLIYLMYNPQVQAYIMGDRSTNVRVWGPLDQAIALIERYKPDLHTHREIIEATQHGITYYEDPSDYSGSLDSNLGKTVTQIRNIYQNKLGSVEVRNEALDLFITHSVLPSGDNHFKWEARGMALPNEVPQKIITIRILLHAANCGRREDELLRELPEGDLKIAVTTCIEEIIASNTIVRAFRTYKYHIAKRERASVNNVNAGRNSDERNNEQDSNGSVLSWVGNNLDTDDSDYNNNDYLSNFGGSGLGGRRRRLSSSTPPPQNIMYRGHFGGREGAGVPSPMSQLSSNESSSLSTLAETDAGTSPSKSTLTAISIANPAGSSTVPPPSTPTSSSSFVFTIDEDDTTGEDRTNDEDDDPNGVKMAGIAFKKMQNALVVKGAKITTLKNKVLELKEDCDDQGDVIDDQNSAIQRLEKDEEGMKTKITTLEERLTISKSTNDELVEENARKDSEKKMIALELEETKGNLATSLLTNVTLTQTVTAKKSENSALLLENQSKDDDIKSKDLLLTDKETEIEQMQADHMEVTNRLKNEMTLMEQYHGEQNDLRNVEAARLVADHTVALNNVTNEKNKLAETIEIMMLAGAKSKNKN